MIESKPKVKELIETYFEYAADKGLKSIESSKYNAIPLNEFFGEMTFDQIKPNNLIRYKKQRQKSDNTLRREFNVLRTAIQVGIDWEVIDVYTPEGDYSNDHVLAERSMKYIAKYRPKAVSRNMTPIHKEFNKILSELPFHVRNIVQFASLTCYRKSEMINLKWCDVDLNKRMIYLKDTKNGDDRDTPMYKELYQFMKYMYSISDKNPNSYVFLDKRGKPFQKFSMYRRWNTACEHAGVINEDGKHKYVLHDLRRYSIRRLQEKYKFTPEIVRVCFSGHRDVDVFNKIYNGLTEDSHKHFYKEITKK